MTAGTSTWSGVNKAGLVLLAIAAAANLVPVQPPEGQPGPPVAILITGAVLGVIALVAIVVAWRHGSRKARLVAVALSVVNALLAVPAFFEPGIPTWLRTVAGIFVAWTAVAVALTLAPNRNG